VEDNGTARPPVSVEGIENGDYVIVTGELKTEGTHTMLNDFWASGIEK
jgi:hydrogenase maturation factor